MKVHHHIRAFEQLLASYDGKLPLHRHLVGYFKLNKQMGGKDRRWASRYIYSYFRLGKALIELPTLTRLAIADFLCNTDVSLITEAHFAEGVEHVGLDVSAKLAYLKTIYPSFQLADVFPFKQELSEGVDKEAFLQSLFVQPDLFIRVAKQKLPSVKLAIEGAGISVKQIGDTCLAMPNGTKLADVISDEGCYQVQDYSSQLTGKYFEPQAYDYWWDCCAASGGKSLLLHSLQPKVKLLVSDLRQTILDNLKERFASAGLKNYQAKVLDMLEDNEQILHHYNFDGVLVDAPCSGAGTWGRTPEMLYFFEEAKVAHYKKLQQQIASNVMKYVNEGKPIIYMTCSIFKSENEDVVQYLMDQFPLRLEKMELIKGYENKADSMFVARLVKV